MWAINDRVGYKPLGMVVKVDDDAERAQDNGDELHFPYHAGLRLYTSSLNSFGLRQFRRLLYLVGIILLILFTAHLTSNSQTDCTASSIECISASNQTDQHKTEVAWHDLNDTDLNVISVMQEINLTDDFHIIRNSYWEEKSDSKGAWWSIGEGDSGKYVTVTNYVRAMKSPGYLDNVTLTTQATIEFMYHTLELCKRWDGPISVAVFCPGPELTVAVTLIKYMRQCLPEPVSTCIRDKVTWHLVYHKSHGPTTDSLDYPESHVDIQHYSSFFDGDKCQKFDNYESIDAVKQFEKILRESRGLLNSNYREQFNIPYPINVLRNTARQAAKTKYVLAEDIELYPSANLEPMFIKYIKEHDVKKESGLDTDKFVFTLPIFEVGSNVTVPSTKPELVELFDKGDAIFFHKYLCDGCQSFPHRTEWLKSDKYRMNFHAGQDDGLVVFEVTPRRRSKLFSEPVYVGTNDDPLYYEALTWEGRFNKVIQMYEMCLQGYRLLVLGNGFLVHAPGIKRVDKKDFRKRSRYVRKNYKLYKSYKSKLRQQYSDAAAIRRC